MEAQELEIVVVLVVESIFLELKEVPLMTEPTRGVAE